jgi:hypothetical protein
MVRTEQVFLPYAITPDGRTLYERVGDARFVRHPAETPETSPAAQRPPTIAFEDVSLDQSRRMSRGPRMDPELYHALKQNIQSLGNTATRLTFLEATSTTTMKHRILRLAAELSILVMVRKIPSSLILWHSTDKDRLQAVAVAVQLQSARQPPQTTRRGRRRTASAVCRRPALGDRGR